MRIGVVALAHANGAGRLEDDFTVNRSKRSSADLESGMSGIVMIPYSSSRAGWNGRISMSRERKKLAIKPGTTATPSPAAAQAQAASTECTSMRQWWGALASRSSYRAGDGGRALPPQQDQIVAGEVLELDPVLVCERMGPDHDAGGSTPEQGANLENLVFVGSRTKPRSALREWTICSMAP